jgi:hypothetical protein
MIAMKLLYGLCVLVFAAALTGCQGGGGGEQAATTHETESAAPQATESEAQATAEGTVAEGEMVTLAGTVGCGHCTFQKTDHCAAVLKTAGGQMYVIDGVEEDSDLWKERMEGSKEAEITGTVSKSEDDGLAHLNMSSYKIM